MPAYMNVINFQTDDDKQHTLPVTGVKSISICHLGGAAFDYEQFEITTTNGETILVKEDTNITFASVDKIKFPDIIEI